MKIRLLCQLMVIFLLCGFVSATVLAQGTLEDYQRAEAFLPRSMDQKVYMLEVVPNWLKDTSCFWYCEEYRYGKRFMVVNPERNVGMPAFDHKRMAAALSDRLGMPVNPDSLPFDAIEFTSDRAGVRFMVGPNRWECDLLTCGLEEIEPEHHEGGMSPDGRWVAFVRQHDLWVRDIESGAEVRLTVDGEVSDAYSSPLPSPSDLMSPRWNEVDREADVIWSPDSKKMISYRLDQSDVGQYHLVQAVAPEGVRPRFVSYAYPLPGDTVVPLAQPIMFDVERRVMTVLDNDPLPVLYYGDAFWETAFDGGDNFYFVQIERGYRKNMIREVNLLTGATRTVFDEVSATCIDPHMWDLRVCTTSSEIIWGSERDGWKHLYLYDRQTGLMKNRVTEGEWVVRYVVHVDEAKRQVFFMGSGREPGRNVYYRHLYRVGFDGAGLTLLTPEDAEHSVDFSPDGKFFVDNYSTVAKEPVAVLRRAADGSVVRELAHADIDDLLATGWRRPEEFVVKGRDGETDIYGVMYRPSNFDSSLSYPVIDKIYTGPHSFFAPKSFRGYRSTAQSIAELGFVVVQIDGMGTGKRSKVFHDVSYKNLGDGGVEDHIAGLEQLAAKYTYMDLVRVGVYGYSAGGYDAAHAILTHPEFYDVAVATAGNHDHRVDKAWWNELWMGYPVGPHYLEQANRYHASNLKGKLLLVHGEMDENVHPASTLQLVDALIQANKDFDLLIVPGEGHYLEEMPYFIRRRWDYFVRHLLGVEPPPEYRIGSVEVAQ